MWLCDVLQYGNLSFCSELLLKSEAMSIEMLFLQRIRQFQNICHDWPKTFEFIIVQKKIEEPILFY